MDVFEDFFTHHNEKSYVYEDSDDSDLSPKYSP